MCVCVCVCVCARAACRHTGSLSRPVVSLHTRLRSLWSAQALGFELSDTCDEFLLPGQLVDADDAALAAVGDPTSRYPARTHSHSLIAYRMFG